MTKLALIADVHGNLAALEAVTAALSRLRHGPLVCLGDVVGYGAQPAECVDALRALGCQLVLGNHEHDVMASESAPLTDERARHVHAFTRRALDDTSTAWLAAQPNLLTEPTFMAAHGCYLNDDHFYGYVTSAMLRDNLEAVAVRASWPKVAFCGHTHAAMCGWLGADGGVEELPGRGTITWPRTARAVIVNPGSVGQPRDRDARASFAIVDVPARQVVFHRVSYDVTATAAAILAAGFPPSLATRLFEGR